MGPNQTKSISMGPIWNTSGTETVISVPVSALGPERAGTEMGCIRQKNWNTSLSHNFNEFKLPLWHFTCYTKQLIRVCVKNFRFVPQTLQKYSIVCDSE